MSLADPTAKRAAWLLGDVGFHGGPSVGGERSRRFIPGLGLELPLAPNGSSRTLYRSSAGFTILLH